MRLSDTKVYTLELTNPKKVFKAISILKKHRIRYKVIILIRIDNNDQYNVIDKLKDSGKFRLINKIIYDLLKVRS
jgi:sulfatase maturation enzyme AslB (radical SAM superfamily)